MSQPRSPASDATTSPDSSASRSPSRRPDNSARACLGSSARLCPGSSARPSQDSNVQTFPASSASPSPASRRSKSAGASQGSSATTRPGKSATLFPESNARTQSADPSTGASPAQVDLLSVTPTPPPDQARALHSALETLSPPVATLTLELDLRVPHPLLLLVEPPQVGKIPMGSLKAMLSQLAAAATTTLDLLAALPQTPLVPHHSAATMEEPSQPSPGDRTLMEFLQEECSAQQDQLSQDRLVAEELASTAAAASASIFKTAALPLVAARTLMESLKAMWSLEATLKPWTLTPGPT